MSNGARWQMHDFAQVFRTRDHGARGITRHSVYHSARYEEVLPGVRMDMERFDRHPTPIWADADWFFDAQRLRAVLLLYPGIAACHAMAARLYGWPLPSNWLTPQLHLATANPNSRIRLSQVTLHRTASMSVRQWFGLPIVSPADVFISFGSNLLHRDLVKLGDAAVGNWHGPPQIGLDELRSSVRNRPFVRGRQRLVDALDRVRESVDSPPETDLRLWAVEVGLPEPLVHPKVHCHTLGRVVEPDLGYPDAKLALEYEGAHHFQSKRQRVSDLNRDEGLRAEGWTVLHVTSTVNYQQLETKIRHYLGLSEPHKA